MIPNDLEVADELIAERRHEKPEQTSEDMTPWQRPITGAIDLLKQLPGIKNFVPADDTLVLW